MTIKNQLKIKKWLQTPADNGNTLYRYQWLNNCIWVFQHGACLLRYSQQILDVLANAVEGETVEIPVLKNATSMALYILKHLTLSLHLSLAQFHNPPMLWIFELPQSVYVTYIASIVFSKGFLRGRISERQLTVYPSFLPERFSSFSQIVAAKKVTYFWSPSSMSRLFYFIKIHAWKEGRGNTLKAWSFLRGPE